MIRNAHIWRLLRELELGLLFRAAIEDRDERLNLACDFLNKYQGEK